MICFLQIFFTCFFLGYFSFIISFLHSSSDSWLSVLVCEWWVRLIFLGKWFWFSCYLFFINLLETCVHGWCSLTSQFIGWARREPVFKQGVFQNARSEQVLLSDANIFSFPTPPHFPLELSLVSLEICFCFFLLHSFPPLFTAAYHFTYFL